ncbi:MAG: hypothetical protein RLY86_1422 [Pseudomonadota bacterium]|jgi:hypothetical protein
MGVSDGVWVFLPMVGAIPVLAVIVYVIVGRHRH